MTTSQPRITARVDAETQDLLSQAAAIAGLPSINAFVLSAAVEKAKRIMERERSLKLSQDDAMRLVEALDRPAKPNVNLQEAAKHYKSKIQS
ncbi:MAG: DUF1778 domain-containing protein [Gammaproteobacteria bacterium]|nr:DUF1778 domain-containing protein [Gammaproteobacteria bacterium]